jgi:hypothetical protein
MVINIKHPLLFDLHKKFSFLYLKLFVTYKQYNINRISFKFDRYERKSKIYILENNILYTPENKKIILCDILKLHKNHTYNIILTIYHFYFEDIAYRIINKLYNYI